MPFTTPGPRALRQTAGAIGAVALIALGAAPASADEAGTGLVLGTVAPVDGVKPGGEFTVPATFTNTGSSALDKVWMSYSVTRGLSHSDMPSNCRRYDVSSFDEAPSTSDLVCEFDQQVEPGVVYAPERPAKLKALDHALRDELRVVVDAHDPAPTEGASDPVQGTGPAVKLAERPDATPAAPGSAKHDGWDAADTTVTADNTADFQVTGARLRGRVGETVDVEVKFTNAGPGWVLRKLDTPATRVLIDFPAGTSVTKAAGFCKKAGEGSYDCGTAQRWVDEGRGGSYAFKVRIDKEVSGAEGSVTLAGEPRPFDPDKANDTAALTLEVTDGGSAGGGDADGGGSTASTGGTSSTGGSGSTAGGSSTGGTSGSASAAGTTGGAASSSASGSTGSTGGEMASTGSDAVLPVTAAAAGAVLVGAGAIVAVRRRSARQR